MDSMLVIGDSQRLTDFQSRTHTLSASFRFIKNQEDIPDLQDIKWVFDLCLDEYPERLAAYAPHAHLFVVGGAVKRSLGEMAAALEAPLKCRLAGINALPFFLTKQAWELSCRSNQAIDELQKLLKSWEIDAHIVDDRVGMVTPRIVAMIVNEACFTVQEGTADQAGIDQAMRLGVNYPGGPFEWVQKIGAKHLYEVMLRMAEDTRNGRYKIAPLLKKLQF